MKNKYITIYNFDGELRWGITNSNEDLNVDHIENSYRFNILLNDKEYNEVYKLFKGGLFINEE